MYSKQNIDLLAITNDNALNYIKLPSVRCWCAVSCWCAYSFRGLVDLHSAGNSVGKWQIEIFFLKKMYLVILENSVPSWLNDIIVPSIQSPVVVKVPWHPVARQVTTRIEYLIQKWSRAACTRKSMYNAEKDGECFGVSLFSIAWWIEYIFTRT